MAVMLTVPLSYDEARALAELVEVQEYTNPALNRAQLALWVQLLPHVVEQGAAPGPVPPQTVKLTRHRAQNMYRVLARLGLDNNARYALAAQVAGRDVQSLTDLIEGEARAVWLGAQPTPTPVQQATAENFRDIWGS